MKYIFLSIIGFLICTLAATAGSMSSAPGDGEKWVRRGVFGAFVFYTALVAAVTIAIREHVQ